MSNEESKSSSTHILDDFKEAYKRLKDRQPQEPENIKLLQSGKLRINKRTLAREAGHSRTNYVNHAAVLRYAESKLGKSHRTKNEGPTLEEANSTYRRDNRDLKKTIDSLRTQNAELLCYIDYLERKYHVPTSSPTDSSKTIMGRARKNARGTIRRLPRNTSDDIGG